MGQDKVEPNRGMNWMLATAERFTPAAILVVAALVILVGFRQGDVRPAEANLLLAESTPYSLLLDQVERLVAGTLATVDAVRGLSAIFMLLAVVVLLGWLKSTCGAMAALIGGIAVTCSLATPILTTQISAVPLFLVCALLMAWSISAIRFHPTAIIWLGIAVLSSYGAFLLLPSFREASWLLKPEDHVLGPFYAVLVSLPWTLAAVLLFSRDFWMTLRPPERRSAWTVSVLGPVAIVGSYFYPEGWLGAAVLLSLTGIVPFAIVAEQRAMNRATVGVTTWHVGLTWLFVLGIPMAAVIAGGVRIAVYHQQMEKVEALVIVGLIAAGLAILALRRKPSTLIWVPVLSVAVSAKILYLTAFVPEWNVKHSSKPYAAAITRHIAPEASLFTTLPTGPNFSYYLGRPVASLDALGKGSPIERYALISPQDFHLLQTKSGTEWDVIRQFSWTAGEPLWLAREVAPPMQATKDKG